ncbi:uncharacterized protein LOC121362810 isoform X2 [Pyrgilauda ruficollis]|uniref:uncharacterized protein LOC121362810 isoform X2 n=1 Tax=Pyrgilauda ruficollis TaxID=221976 RepID=UPI001B86824B|nr:uncharacterized protein LOC121362810 isoform X2 [Pyrgilauda ruficollis]
MAGSGSGPALETQHQRWPREIYSPPSYSGKLSMGADLTLQVSPTQGGHSFSPLALVTDPGGWDRRELCHICAARRGSHPGQLPALHGHEEP